MDIVVDIVDNHFNPRLREGGDFSSLSSVDGETISIHASAEEATMVGCIYRHFKGISIHASAKEATCGAVSGFSGVTISIHASAKEATWRV